MFRQCTLPFNVVFVLNGLSRIGPVAHDSISKMVMPFWCPALGFQVVVFLQGGVWNDLPVCRIYDLVYVEDAVPPECVDCFTVVEEGTKPVFNGFCVGCLWGASFPEGIFCINDRTIYSCQVVSDSVEKFKFFSAFGVCGVGEWCVFSPMGSLIVRKSNSGSGTIQEWAVKIVYQS